MRGWSWIGGALVVLVGVTLIVGTVGAPRRTAPVPSGLELPARPAARVPRAGAGAGVLAEVQPNGEIADGGEDADERDRQRAEMRAAVERLIAGEDAGARIR